MSENDHAGFARISGREVRRPWAWLYLPAFQNGIGPQIPGVVRLPVFRGVPVEAVVHVDDRVVVFVAAEAVHDGADGQPLVARMRVGVAHALARHQTGAERVAAHHPLELPVGEVGVLFVLKCVPCHGKHRGVTLEMRREAVRAPRGGHEVAIGESPPSGR